MGTRNSIIKHQLPANKKDRIYFLSRIVGSYYAAKNYAVFKEVGLPKLNSSYRFGCKRADILCLNSKDEVIILETKSSWEDYKSDKKWSYYLDWCNKFYFVADSELANRMKEDLDNKDVGIISVSEDIFFLKNARKRSPEILEENLIKLHKAIIFRASSFRADGSINQFSQFYPPKFISSWQLKSCNQ